jgi:hypothetical protein
MAPLGAKLSVALVHHPISGKEGNIITTSVTTLDIHDFARTCRTFGVAALYIVTPLPAQQRLVERLIRHWREGAGAAKNPTRKEALTRVEVVDSVEKIMDNPRFDLERPLIITTSAAKSDATTGYGATRERMVSTPWSLLLFGTGGGLAPAVMDMADVRLDPIEGVDDFNHLPVRSASAIILDRLLGRGE